MGRPTAASLYGFAIGASKNLTYGWRSSVRFPLLLLGTAALCALAQCLLARFVGLRLPFRSVQRASLEAYRAVAVLLGSISPVSLFLGQTMVQPDARSLGGYPGFVLVNVVFITIAGCVSLVLQTRSLVREHQVAGRQATIVVIGWLVMTLLVGGQLAFWLRPFFDIAWLTGEPPFLLGSEPTATGARNSYEAVWAVRDERRSRRLPATP